MAAPRLPAQTRDRIGLPYRLDDRPAIDPGTRFDGPAARLLVVGPFEEPLGAARRAPRPADGATLSSGAAGASTAEARAAWAALGAIAGAGERDVDLLFGTPLHLAEGFADAPAPHRSELGARLATDPSPYALVVGLFELGFTAQSLTVLEACASLGERTATAFAFGASPELAAALQATPASPLADRLDRLRDEPAARWLCLVPGAVEVASVDRASQCRAVAAAALGACFVASGPPGTSGANVIGLETGGAPSARFLACEPETDPGAWRRLAEAGLAALLRAPDGRTYFPGAPTLARIPSEPPWAPEAFDTPQARGRLLATQLPWVLLGADVVRLLAWSSAAHREQPPAALLHDELQPRLHGACATRTLVSQPIRRRRPFTERSVAQIAPKEGGFRLELWLELHGFEERPYVDLPARGFLPAPRGGPAGSRPRTPRESTLLAAIGDAVDDDEARLVYADYLMELGDPRGELVALQVRRARGGETAADRAREEELLRAHGEAWLGPLGPLVDTARTRFERGFLARVKLSGRSPTFGLSSVVQHPSWRTVRELTLASWGLQDSLALVTSPALCELRALFGAAPELMVAIARTRTVERLRLERVGLELQGPPPDGLAAALQRFPSLRAIELRCPREASVHAARLGRYVPPGLEELVFTCESDVLDEALASAEDAGVQRFVYTRRAGGAPSSTCSFERGPPGQLARTPG